MSFYRQDEALQPPRPSFADRGSYSSSESLDPASSTSDSDGPPISVRNRKNPVQPRANKLRSPSTGGGAANVPKAARRRSTQGSTSYAALDSAPQLPDPFSDTQQHGQHGDWRPDELYQDGGVPASPLTSDLQHFPSSPSSPENTTKFNPQRDYRNSSSSRAPPSSFAFPFQAYAGNPDPLPRTSRRSSLESMNRRSSDGNEYALSSLDHGRAFSDDNDHLPRPQAPFMARGAPSSPGGGSSPASGSPANSRPNSVYRNSAAGSMGRASASQIALDSNGNSLPRTSSMSNMRAPFLSPSSRPTSTAPWQPPNHAVQVDENGHPLSPRFGDPNSPNASSTFLAHGAIPKRTPLRSTLLVAPLSKTDKPWLGKPDRRGRVSWWITFFCLILGLLGAAAMCFFGVTGVRQMKDSDLCLLMDDEFNGGDLDEGWWNKQVELGGFGNGEFEMTTSDSAFLSNGQLYLYPSLTADDGTDIFKGSAYTLSGCTNTHNKSACSVTPSGDRIIPPIKSARINTKGKVSMTYGKVEVKAKLPRGDWLWPAIWMLPDGYDDDAYGLGKGAYGYWPVSGEIDIMEARGNGKDYSYQGNNFVRSSLNFGPMTTLLRQLFGWYSLKRSSFSDSFHTYSMEWDSDFMRFYTDKKLNAMLNIRTRNYKEGFFHRGGFPKTTQNGSSEIVVENPWAEYSYNDNAPYDQPFYLIINLSAGGTSGWFPDMVGNKPWYDGSSSAMWDFAAAKDSWYPTWPASQDDRAFRIEYVKMWKKC